ncbi:MAG: hypothetical protein QF685_01965 [Verrucomicrobiota bacterium]|jgi:hypothetical protein|nr:hypothetical protein [Verrucomicrobiota bacterium]
MFNTKATPIDSLTPGSVEIKGRVDSDLPPVSSPYSQKSCVFYHFRLSREVYNPQEHYGSHQYNELINDRVTDPILIRDQTGAVEIDAEQIENLGAQSLYQKKNTSGEMQQRILGREMAEIIDRSDNAHIRLLAILKTRYGKDPNLLQERSITDSECKEMGLRTPQFLMTVRITGNIKFQEYYLEKGKEVHVFGNAREVGGKMVIGAGEMPFIISDSGEAAVEADYGKLAHISKMVYYICIPVGLLILSVGILLIGIGLFFHTTSGSGL